MILHNQFVVADTDTVSHIARRSPLAEYYLPRLEGRRVVISFQTWEESMYGAYRANWDARSVRRLETQLLRYEVQWPNDGLIQISAQLRHRRLESGRKLKSAQAWIAATALYLNCPLATHDRDFIGIPNLQLITALDQ